MNWTKPIDEDPEELDLDELEIWDDRGLDEVECICGAVIDADTLDDPPAVCPSCGAALGRLD